jgi:hypothetical protein
MSNNNTSAATGGAIYALGIFGAWVYFWIQADTLWQHLFAIIQGIFWPAYMVYDIFVALHR